MASLRFAFTIFNFVRNYQVAFAVVMTLVFSAVAMGAPTSCAPSSPWSAEQAALIVRIENAYSKNCRPRSTSEDCFVKEGDVFSQSLHPENVLLFRGEAADRPIGQSALFTFAQKHPRFCKAPCLEQTVLEQFQQALEKIPEEAPGSLCKEDSQVAATFRMDLRRWVERRPDIRCDESPLLMVGRDHIHAGHRFRIQEGTVAEDAFPFDPFISLSIDPYISLRFANLTSCNPGRLVVLSVDKARVPKVPTAESDAEMNKALNLGSYVRFNATQGETFQHEQEIDAIVRIPPGDIKVVIAPHQKLEIRK